MTVKRNKYNFKQLNQELNELYMCLKEENYTPEEINEILLPITSKIRESYKKYYVALTLLVLPLVLYLLSHFDYFNWHFSAIGRIFMIKMLPYFDWRYLKNERCLIPPKFGFSNSNEPIHDAIFNCDLCETVRNVDVYKTIDEDILTQAYVDLHVPVVFTKGIDHWVEKENLIGDLISDDVFYNSEPCRLSTNIFNGVGSTGTILERAKIFESFFMHFQNCDLTSVKVFRKFLYRPDFLPEYYSPISYNWLVWNRNYNTTNYKKIDLVEKITIFGQISGGSYLRLTPRKNCQFSCPTLNLVLQTGESIIFTSLWDLEYKPYEDGENLAAIWETRD